MSRVLIVDDQDGDGMRLALMAGGYDSRIVGTVEDAIVAIASFRPCLVIFDHSSTPRGVGLFQAIGTRPAIVCSASDSLTDRVSCLKMGADDFIAKPFDQLELLERVNAVIRRSYTPDDAQVIRVGALMVNQTKVQVTLSGELVHLTPTQFRILVHLASTSSIVRTNDIGRAIWGTHYNDTKTLVHCQVARLRTKMLAITDHPRIDTVRSTGYRLVA